MCVFFVISHKLIKHLQTTITLTSPESVIHCFHVLWTSCCTFFFLQSTLLFLYFIIFSLIPFFVFFTHLFSLFLSFVVPHESNLFLINDYSVESNFKQLKTVRNCKCEDLLLLLYTIFLKNSYVSAENYLKCIHFCRETLCWLSSDLCLLTFDLTAVPLHHSCPSPCCLLWHHWLSLSKCLALSSLPGPHSSLSIAHQCGLRQHLSLWATGGSQWRWRWGERGGSSPHRWKCVQVSHGSFTTSPAEAGLHPLHHVCQLVTQMPHSCRDE